MIYEEIQDFPAEVGQTDVTLRAVNVVGVQEGPFSLMSETQVFPGARWEIEIAFLPEKRREAQRLEAFLLSLRGRAGRVRLGDPYRSLPLGSNLGTPYAIALVAGEDSFRSGGWMKNASGLLLAGDMIQLRDRLHQVLRDVNSDANGEAIISIWPPLRDNVLLQTEIITQNARGIFSLASNALEFSRTIDQLNYATLTAVEVIEAALSISRIATVGDSITENGGGQYGGNGNGGADGIGNYVFLSIGFAAWLRILLRGGYDLVPSMTGTNAPKLNFAYSGQQGAQIHAQAIAAGVLTSNAELITEMSGTNDVGASMTAADIETKAQIRLVFWKQVRAAGKRLLALGPPPYGAGIPNSAAVGANLVTFDNRCAELAAANGFDYLSIRGVMETAPGLAPMDRFNNSDGYHPNERYSLAIARPIARFLATKYNFGIDRIAASSNWITGGTVGVAAPPPNFGVGLPSGGLLVSQQIVSDPSGDWWEVVVDNGVSASNSTFYLGNLNQAPIGGNVAGKTLDAICEIWVKQGELSGANIRLGFNEPSFAVFGQSTAGQNLAVSSLLPSDGPCLLWTQPVIAPPGTTRPMLFVDFRSSIPGNLRIWVRNAGTRLR